MSLSRASASHIIQTIKTCIQKKLQNYNPETNHMPFHHRLLGRDKMALFSFIHSLNTTFGVSIFEPAAEVLSRSQFQKCTTQYTVGKTISAEAQRIIQDIIDDLSRGDMPNKTQEIERIRAVCRQGAMKETRAVKADLMLQDKTGNIYLFDIKTAKPNVSNFKDFKRTLLTWIAMYFSYNPQARIHSLIAIPYNPYHPKPYQRWTMQGMLDGQTECKVAEEFWDFIGGKGAYELLLDCFEKAGKELQKTINDYFAQFSSL